jgi:hypothetical protein
MLTSIKSHGHFLSPYFVVLLAACSSSNSSSPATGGDSGSLASDSGSLASDSGPVGSAQTPPTNGADVETWLKGAAYKSWHCEAAVHAARSPSPHGMNRICSNDLASSFSPTGDSGIGERPQGTAAVKELYDDAGMNIVGYAVYLKTQATSAAGANWYWYERVPTSSMVPHDSAGVVADGMGGAGTPLSICVACHGAAGSDTAHTPSPGGGDEVYTQVH